MDAIFRKVGFRVLPLLFLCYLVNYLDRTNISFAKLTMSSALGIGDAAYGLGAGLFFIGYFLFQVPSNLLLVRLGARRWIAAILVLWGLVSASTVLVRSAGEFYAARFCLGAAEAGLFPGIILYLTAWFPAGRRGRILAAFLAAIPLSGLAGGPLSGGILQAFRDGALGLRDWQWLFLLESLPCFLLAAWVVRGLPSSPSEARWLSAPERAALEGVLREEAAAKAAQGVPQGAAAAFRQPAVWLLSGLYFGTMMGLYGYSFWLPQTIQALGWSGPLRIGLLSAIPSVAAVAFMAGWSARSDRRRERRLHAAGAAFLAAAGFLGVGLALHGGVGLAALCFAYAGVMGLMATLWTIPGAFLGGTAAAAGIAAINSVGNLGGFASPLLLGKIVEKAGTPAAASSATAAFLLAVGLALLASPFGKRAG